MRQRRRAARRAATAAVALALVLAMAAGPPASAAAAAPPVGGLAAWHAAGIDGAGVTVAVIDAGFEGLADAQARGELPAATSNGDLCDGRFATASSHGTAVAEVVHDMAPGARLVLICAPPTAAALEAAKDLALERGATIVNLSSEFYNQGRGDGQGGPGTPEATVADARRRGALWVAGAGNNADKHWAGTFAGADGSYHEWVAGDTTNAIMVGGGRLACAYLRWDDWPRSDQDFDLYLVDANGEIASGTGGARRQSGTQPPTEAACVRNDGPAATYAIAIWRRHATRTPRMDVIVGNGVGPFEHAVPSGSIADPAGSPDAFAVGAICSQTGALQPYSARGPAIDDRVKPDVVGPDSLSTLTFGAFFGCGLGFAGTSASAPAVAGAAALAQQALPGRGPDATASFLRARAIDLGVPGPDNAFGAGALALGTPPASRVPSAAAASATALRRVRVTCRRSGLAGRRRITCALRPHTGVRSVGARLERGPRTLAVLRPRARPSGRFTIGGAARGLAAGRYRVVVVLRDRAGRSRTVRVPTRV